jgi:hypothetical protein
MSMSRSGFDRSKSSSDSPLEGDGLEHAVPGTGSNCCRGLTYASRGKDPEAALPSFRPRHRVHACGALDIFPLRALDVDQIAE